MTGNRGDGDGGHGARGRRRRWWWWLGLVLSLTGLGVLIWAAWEFYGTNWVSRRAQAAAIRSVEKQWHAGHRTAHVSAGEVTSVIRIPRFGASYAVPLLEGTSEEVLATGFGHFAGTADPGAVGNFAIAAHRVTHGEPLRNMPDLQPGDKVIVVTQDWTYTYALTSGGSALVVPMTAGWVLAPVPKNPSPGGIEPAQHPGQRLITLATCSELFHTDNRMIAFGVLVGKSPTRL